MPKTASRVEKARRESLNLKDEQIKQLKRLFPEVVADGKVSWEKLKAILGETVDTSFEKFSFTWAGKGEAIRNVLVPSRATLRPDKKESVRFDESQNIFIEGDNLEVLKLLQNAYFEKVKMIYIDPPYNTGNDFVYKDDFKNSLKNYLSQTGQIDNGGNRMQTNTEASGRFHSDWLNMMYPRLKLAWNLLSEDGAIFVSIDDNECHRLRVIMDEIFGEENFVNGFAWQSRTSKQNDTDISSNHEYIVVYAKCRRQVERRLKEKNVDKWYEIAGFVYYPLPVKKSKYSNPDNDKRGDWKADPFDAPGVRPNLTYPIKNSNTGKEYLPPAGRHWRTEEDEYKRLLKDKRIVFGTDGRSRPQLKVFYDEKVKFGEVDTTWWDGDTRGTITEGTKELLEIFEGKKIFDFPKPTRLIESLIGIATRKDEIILDFFAGSGTAAHAVMKYNKENRTKHRFVLVQMAEPTPKGSDAHKAGFKTIADIGKERIRRVISGYGEEPQPIKDGFKVFKLSPSNYPENNFEYDPEKSEQENTKAYKSYLEKAGQLDLFSKVSDEDLVYENVIKEGLDLNSKISELSLGKNKVFQAKDDKSEILICLDSKIADATVKALSSDDHKGKIFVCYDKAVDDSAKANLGLHLSLRTI